MENVTKVNLSQAIVTTLSQAKKLVKSTTREQLSHVTEVA